MSAQQHLFANSTVAASEVSTSNQPIADHLTPDLRRGAQQPSWEDLEQVQLVREQLESYAPLVQLADVDNLSEKLAAAARGELLVLQIGDCAEDPAERTAEHVAAKTALLARLADLMERATGVPVLRVGRIAGQFAKPRSNDRELVGGLELPIYRGHLVNNPNPNIESRRPDPQRLLTGFSAAREIMGRLGWGPAGAESSSKPTVWTSHEALVLDYEQPLVREHSDGRFWLSSTHWPWIGERTRQVHGPHLALLSQVANPVACKIGPSMSAGEITLLCDRLDPNREPGRLTLIARMGAAAVATKLPALVAAVRSAGHPVIWLCDPMHGNGTITPDGRKTRYVSTIIKEVHAFRQVVEQAGGVAGGLHLETTPDDVLECVEDAAEAQLSSGCSTTLCDPRLNAAQAASVVAAWTSASKIPRVPSYPMPTRKALPANVAQWTVDPKRAVLLLHDMQSFFLKPLASPLRAELVHNSALLRKRCVDLGVRIAYTAQPGGMTAAQRGLLKDFWGPGMSTEPGERGVVPELTPADSDWLLTKWRYSAFHNSDLLARMRAEGRDQLILSGVYAHIGVLTTALEAFSHDIQPFLVADALGDFTEAEHHHTLAFAAKCCAMVVLTEDVLP